MPSGQGQLGSAVEFEVADWDHFQKLIRFPFKRKGGSEEPPR
jgi:hypothetical protein